MAVWMTAERQQQIIEQVQRTVSRCLCPKKTAVWDAFWTQYADALMSIVFLNHAHNNEAVCEALLTTWRQMPVSWLKPCRGVFIHVSTTSKYMSLYEIQGYEDVVLELRNPRPNAIRGFGVPHEFESIYLDEEALSADIFNAFYAAKNTIEWYEKQEHTFLSAITAACKRICTVNQLLTLYPELRSFLFDELVFVPAVKRNPLQFGDTALERQIHMMRDFMKEQITENTTD